MEPEGAAQDQFLRRHLLHRHAHVAATCRAAPQCRRAGAAPRAPRPAPGRRRSIRRARRNGPCRAAKAPGPRARRAVLSARSAPSCAGHAQRVVGQVGRDDLGSPGAAGGEDRQHPDRTAAGDQYPLAQQLPGLVRGVQAYRQRLGHRRLARASARRPATHWLASATSTLAERALNMRKRHRRAVEAHVQTLVRQALQAEPAVHRRAARATRRPVAPRPARSPLAQRHRHAPETSCPRIIGSRSRTAPKPPWL